MCMSKAQIDELVGITLRQIIVNDDENGITFVSASSGTWQMRHDQDCCEHVRIEEVIGDLDDLVDSPILDARVESNSDNPPINADSWTWTFYILRTQKGTVTLRWLGESNGYYSESVYFSKIA